MILPFVKKAIEHTQNITERESDALIFCANGSFERDKWSPTSNNYFFDVRDGEITFISAYDGADSPLSMFVMCRRMEVAKEIRMLQSIYSHNLKREPTGPNVIYYSNDFGTSLALGMADMLDDYMKNRRANKIAEHEAECLHTRAKLLQDLYALSDQDFEVADKVNLPASTRALDMGVIPRAYTLEMGLEGVPKSKTEDGSSGIDSQLAEHVQQINYDMVDAKLHEQGEAYFQEKLVPRDRRSFSLMSNRSSYGDYWYMNLLDEIINGTPEVLTLEAKKSGKSVADSYMETAPPFDDLLETTFFYFVGFSAVTTSVANHYTNYEPSMHLRKNIPALAVLSTRTLQETQHFGSLVKPEKSTDRCRPHDLDARNACGSLRRGIAIANLMSLHKCVEGDAHVFWQGTYLIIELFWFHRADAELLRAFLEATGVLAGKWIHEKKIRMSKILQLWNIEPSSSLQSLLLEALKDDPPEVAKAEAFLQKHKDLCRRDSAERGRGIVPLRWLSALGEGGNTAVLHAWLFGVKSILQDLAMGIEPWGGSDFALAMSIMNRHAQSVLSPAMARKVSDKYEERMARRENSVDSECCVIL